MERDKALWYLIGALRDGSVYYYQRSRNYYVIWYSSNKSYLERIIIPRLKKLGYSSAKVYQYKKGHYRVRISSKRLYQYIAEKCEHPVYTHEPWPTPPPIRRALLDLKIEYVRGFVDAEGSVISSQKGFQIDISQKIKEPLEFLQEVLAEIGIRTTGIYKGPDNVWRLRISSISNIARFHNLVGFRHPCKRKRLVTLLRRSLPGSSRLKGIGGGAPQGVEPAA